MTCIRRNHVPGLLTFTLAAAVLLTFGCSRVPRNVAAVKGKVSLGGQPLADALVTFSPVAGGSPSAGRTNASGEFELVYSRDAKGAEKGDHNVEISTLVPAMEDPPTPEVPEKVPHVYRDGAKKLTAKVNSGNNEINFDLEPGPVNPPQAKGKGKGKLKGPLPCY